MEDNITINNLIETGNAIRDGITYVPPKSEIRTFKLYQISDEKAFADWKALVNMYLAHHGEAGSAQEVRGLFEKFEKKHNSPQVFDEIMGILKALKTIYNNDAGQQNANITSVSGGKNRKVFIVHGHNEEYIQKVARFLEKLECEPIILKEQANSGRTIIEKFEDLSNAAYGVVLYTACDKGSVNNDNSELKPRARQNVIFEHGYLFAKLGRERVCALVEEGVEIPSDLAGVLYVHIDDADAWKFKLAKEMRSVGIDIDMNKIL